MRIAVALLSVLLFSSYFLIAQVKDDIVKKHMEAIGGEKNWQQVKTLRSVLVRESEGMIIEEKKQMIMNKALRIDYHYQSRDAALGEKNYFILVNEQLGWKYLPDNRNDSVETMTPAEVAYYKSEHFRLDPFLPGNKSLTAAEYLSKENIADQECLKFLMRYADGHTEYLYLDAHSYLIVRTVRFGGDTEAENDFDDYRLVNGTIKMPFRIRTPYEQCLVKEVLLNTVLDEKIFKRPK